MKKLMKKSVIVTALVVSLLAVTVSVSLAAGGGYHTVYYGETLYSIGRMYGVNPYQIANANGIVNPNYIYSGQVIYIPVQNIYSPSPVVYPNPTGCSYGCANYHVVAYGETLSSIARLYGVSPWDIANANRIYNLHYIYAGQTLTIPQGRYYY